MRASAGRSERNVECSGTRVDHHGTPRSRLFGERLLESLDFRALG